MGRDGDEDLAALEGVVVPHAEAADVVEGLVRIGNVEELLVGREAEAVRAREVGRHDDRLLGAGVEPEDVVRRLLAPFRVDAIGGIGEPERPVGLDDRVVRGVQALARVGARERRDGCVLAGARDGAAPVLARDEPSLEVDGVPVRVVRGLAPLREAVRLGPPVDGVGGDVAEEQIPLRHPCGPLGEPEALGDPDDGGA